MFKFFGFFNVIRRTKFVKLDDFRFDHPFERNFRVNLTDIDFNRHVSNSRYLAYLDLPRIEWAIRSGAWRRARELNLVPMLESSFVRHRKELRWRDKFKVIQELVYIGPKWVYVDCKFIKEGVMMCHALQKMGFYQRGVGMYPPIELYGEEAKTFIEKQNIPDYVQEFLKFEEDFRNSVSESLKNSPYTIKEKP